MSTSLVRGLLVLLGSSLGLLAGEVGLRLWGAELMGPAPGALQVPEDDPRWDELDEAQLRGRIPDPDFGIRPPVGARGRDEYGALANDYAPDKPEGVLRILLLGDSVAERGLFLQALREESANGDAAREWWNAGVSGFGTRQEALFYERFARGLNPDHLLLLFHPNDFQATPVVYQDARGRLVTYQPHRPALRPNLWLLRRSYVYRAYVHLRLRGGDPPGLVEEVRAALERLAALTEAQGARFSVVLLPTFVGDPDAVDRTSRETALALFRELGLRHFDLEPALREAVADGVDPQQTPGDYEHPSLDVCRYFARALWAAGLLEAGPPRVAPVVTRD